MHRLSDEQSLTSSTRIPCAAGLICNRAFDAALQARPLRSMIFCSAQVPLGDHEHASLGRTLKRMDAKAGWNSPRLFVDDRLQENPARHERNDADAEAHKPFLSYSGKPG